MRASSPRRDPRRLPLATPERRAAAATVAVLVAVVAVAAAVDPSGLLAPVGGRGLPLLGGGVYRWAPLAVGLPILLAGSAAPVLLIARTGRAASARWVFATSWVAVVGAAALAAAATGFAATVPLLGAHLSAGSALRFALATSGFAAIKLLVVGPLVAGAAALAFRIGPGQAAAGQAVPGAATGKQSAESGTPAPPATGMPVSVPVSAAVMFGVTGLAALGFAARWWRGGPVGYAFSGPLVAPTGAAGWWGFLAGTGVFLGAFTVVVRTAQRRIGRDIGPPVIAATVWLAAIVAGFALGIVDAVVAALPVSAQLSHAGPDSWWIATTLVSIATGVGYGATVGVLGAAVVTVVWRLRTVASVPAFPARWRIAAATLGLALLAVAPLVGVPGSAGPPRTAPVAATGGMERLQLVPAHGKGGLATIGDVTGRQVILRGVNVNQLIDYYLRDPAVPADQPLTDADFTQMAQLGFNVVRLGMSWSRLEPSRGQFDSAYLQQIRTAVAEAKAHGIYTVLDMHEDAWGNALAQPSAQCGGGTTPTTGWDGAPAWATETDGAAYCQFMARDLAPAVATAFSNFYTDRDGIQRELVRTWAYVAQSFADEPAVAGYDLLNEPGIGADPPISSGLLLGRYYDAAITAIRGAETAGGGFAHLIFFEPSVLWSGLGFDVAPPPGFTHDRQLVFAPHPYSESITLDQSFGLTIASIERNLAMSARAAASYGAALWAGEWGWFGDPSTDGAKVARFVAAQDRLGIGGAFWVWRQGCGSPETGADATTSGNLVGIDCATGASIAPPAAFAEPLTTAYPRAFPGRLDTLVPGSGQDLSFTATVDANADAAATNCRLDVWVPGDAQPHPTTTGIDDLSAQQVPGGWQLTGCAHGTYTFAIAPG